MQVTTERLPDCQVKLTVEVAAERMAGSVRQIARKLSRQVRIPGFRPGKAPFNVIERRFGRETLLTKVVEEEGQGWYKEALAESDLEPYSQAQMEVTSYEPLVITFTLQVAPAVDLGEYRDIRFEWQPPMVSDEDVEKELARLQQENASQEPRDRPAELDDVATLDIKGYINDELVVDANERAIALNLGINYPVANFAPEIVGLAPGQDREFTLTYPQNHPNAAWAGKETFFKVHLHGLKVWVTPELDDELAQTMGEYETLDEWRASAREELETKALNRAEYDYANSVVDALVEQAHIEFPAALVDRELDKMMEDADKSLKQRGLGLENYLVMTGQNKEDYRESMRKDAEGQVERGLALTELVAVERLEISETDIDAEIDRTLEALGDEAENYRQFFASKETRDSIHNTLLTRSAIDTLKAIARGEYMPQAPSEPEKEDEPSREAKTTETAKEVTEEKVVDEAPESAE